MSWQKRVPTEYSKPHQKVILILNELLREGLKFSFLCEQLVPTRFREWPFKVDVLITAPFNGVCEILGKRWHSRTATQRKKVEVKKECLTGEGYRYLEVWDDGLKTKAGREKVKEELREWLKG